MIGQWREPPCRLCGEAIKSTPHHREAPLFLRGPNVWVHRACYEAKQGTITNTQKQEEEEGEPE